MTVYYEWDVEVLETESKDIIDHHHVESYKEALEVFQILKSGKIEGQTYQIVLVRDTDKERSWAYIEDNKFTSEQFEDAFCVEVSKIPKRFKDEVARAS